MSNHEKTSAGSVDLFLVTDSDATIGEKLKTLRLSRNMTLSALSRAAGISERVLRGIENSERLPCMDAIRKLSGALCVATDYFIDDDLFRQELQREEILSRAKEKYGSRGKAQARLVYESAQGFYAGGMLEEEEWDSFRDLMIELFFETKEYAKRFTPKKYRK